MNDLDRWFVTEILIHEAALSRFLKRNWNEGAEVADLSEAMRLALKKGTAGITSRLARALEAGIAEKSLSIHGSPEETAQSLYQLWLGASVMVKIVRDREPFEAALKTTRQILHLTH